MRPLLFAFTLVLPLLSACARASTESPAAVLEKAVQAARSLRSAHVEGEAVFHELPVLPLGVGDGVARFEGDLQDAGRQLRMRVDLTGSRVDGAERRSIDASADIIVLDGSETYLRLRSLSLGRTPSDDPARQVEALLGGLWWSLTPARTEAEEEVTPDPRFLRMQAEAVRVVRDRGIVGYDGAEAFLYDVQTDPAKLSAVLGGPGAMPDALPQAEGTLWIDTQSYVLRRAQWNIRMPEGGTLELDLAFSDFDATVTITPPEDALPFPANGMDLLDAFPPAP